MTPSTEQFHHFLDTHLPRPGIVAVAIRQRDKSVITRNHGNALTTTQIEQCIAQLVLASDGLRRHRIESRSLCWTFEKAHIHLAHRPDGAFLAIFSENIPNEPPNEDAQELVTAFNALM